MTTETVQAVRFNILGVAVSALGRHQVVNEVIDAARRRKRLGVSALAVHGIMLATGNPAIRARLNRLDIVTPDGQPVRWALNILHRAGLAERVYGPDLMRDVSARARDEGLPIFLYGSTTATLEALERSLKQCYSGVIIAGAQPSRFRPISEHERAEQIRRIRDSGAAIVFVGLGCPRQEIWVYENMHELSIPVLAVGAAFDYLAGKKAEPPNWMMRAGLQWTHRLIKEPRRLWKRYLLLNPLYLILVCLQGMRLRRFPMDSNMDVITAVRPG